MVKILMGLGTGVGTALVLEGAVQPMELARLPYKNGTYEDYLGKKGLERLGLKRWRKNVFDCVSRLTLAPSLRTWLSEVVMSAG